MIKKAYILFSILAFTPIAVFAQSLNQDINNGDAYIKQDEKAIATDESEIAKERQARDEAIKNGDTKKAQELTQEIKDHKKEIGKDKQHIKTHKKDLNKDILEKKEEIKAKGK